MKKLILAVAATSVFSILTAFAGPGLADSKAVLAPAPTPASLYADSEFNISLMGSGMWTFTDYLNDRYFGVDHAFGGTLDANYFFKKYFGVGIGFSGYDVRNISTPARVATSNDSRRFVGDLLVNTTLRYPIGTSPFAPYIRGGLGPIFNGGNQQLVEPDGTPGKQIRFELVEHDVKMVAEGAVGVEFRINKTFGILTECAFDKIDRPHSNFMTIRAGVNVAF
jgi:hypothetical protein